ncbi:MAG TPA: NAD(P)H-hydrate epimerase, partial [Candidatus Limnocylindrales bacterium]
MNSRTALLDVRQMHEAERLTVGTGVSETEVMENVGAAVAREIVRRWPPCALTVLCGPGRNGGDGFVVARLLAEADWPVRVALLGP